MSDKPKSDAPGVLVTSAGAKLPLLRALREAMKEVLPHACLWAADSNPDCPARQYADAFYHSPPWEKMSDDDILSAFAERSIQFILPTRDGELQRFAQLAKKQPVPAIMVAPPASVGAALDKLAFFQKLHTAGLPVITTEKCSANLDTNRLVVKERWGSGGKNTGMDLTPSQARAHAQSLVDPIYQPFVQGREFSADTYLHADGSPHGIVLRWRDRVVSGESHQSTTFTDTDIADIVAMAAKVLGMRYHAVFQGIVGQEGDVHLLEANARVGGASVLSFAAGLHSLHWFLQEAQGYDITRFPFNPLPHALRLIRTDTDAIFPV